ncbi:hypothetical protein CKM354_001061000 [Cercospora kikuchii]|uniref:Lytic polysaccharide monooxygenase n=1 Tax=Cercospora kikuchii TaxID=84275 RepID=A0A9P3FHG3_9PEZI|nr:uncharacterized protein CKM354_001061000 [Cercospora kikuchii]GIZ47521.1 hypothetical protein CKM354_001061000 [Cercospora kikuchii]
MFSKSFLTAAAACSLLVSSVNAHMMITSPVPYGADSLNNSPLEPDGSDFPCKQRSGVYDISQVNEMPVGVPQTLSFKGGATHGGGSCQLSVTLDKNPTKSSEWKVIHSILGGCPNSAAGNANGSPTYSDNPTFQYTMPKGMPNGEYTLAWTWFNKIGNREMYMNCAPIKVTGGADNNEVYNSLPDMFVANIGNGCGTTEGEDFVFPQCGLNVETAMQTALGSSTSGTCAAPTGGSGSGSGGSSPAEPTGYSSPANSPAAPTYGSGASSAAPVAPSYGGGSGAGASPAPSAPSYGGASPAAPQAPAPTGYGSGAASSVEGGAAAGGIATTYEVHTATEIRTITADGPAPTGYGSPAGPGGASGGSPSNYGGSNKGKVSSGSGSSDSGSSESGSSPAAPADNSTSSGTCSGNSVPCSKQDEVVCLDNGKWGLCDHGCVFPMALTSGTACQGGVISKRHSMAAHVRRHLRPHSHKF